MRLFAGCQLKQRQGSYDAFGALPPLCRGSSEGIHRALAKQKWRVLVAPSLSLTVHAGESYTASGFQVDAHSFLGAVAPAPTTLAIRLQQLPPIPDERSRETCRSCPALTRLMMLWQSLLFVGYTGSLATDTMRWEPSPWHTARLFVACAGETTHVSLHAAST